jgi:hypothetical protein
MKTLLDQWKELEIVIEQKCKTVVDEYLRHHELPKVFYVVHGYHGIDKCTVMGIRVNEYKVNDRKPYLSSNKKPTKIQVAELSNYVLGFNPNETHLGLEYEQMDSYGKSTGLRMLVDIVPEKGESFNQDELLPILAKKKELYEPREGYIQCEYCSQQRLPQDIMQGIIISPNWRNNGYRSPLRNYCKDKPCHAHDQMGHEG